MTSEGEPQPPLKRARPEDVQPALKATACELARLLQVIEVEILPETRKGVTAGNKVFGAAVLGPDLTTKIADTNHETENPLFHGEVYVLQRWAAETPPAERGNSAATAVFLSTHEPCCMCISSLVWAGFKRVFYLFPYLTTSAQGIPHDLDIMHELWNVPTYQKRNKFCATAGITELVDALEAGEEKDALQATIARISGMYDELSQQYHKEKVDNSDNSLAFG